jgi:hypothetical protein
MKVRIEADGSALGTKIYGPNGDDITRGVNEVSFKHQGGGVPELHIGVFLAPAVFEGEARMYGPNGKEVSKVIYVDGTETVY